MPQLTANDYTMHYQINDFTDPWSASEAIWIQHGFGRNLNFWYHWIPLLAGHYRVLRRDMRGHGGSADPGPDYVWSVDDLLGDMKGFLDALEIDAVHYIGESVGGILGIAFATKWPERFKSLTLCASPTSIRPHIQKTFALGYEDWPTALGTLGSGGLGQSPDRTGLGAGWGRFAPFCAGCLTSGPKPRPTCSRGCAVWCRAWMWNRSCPRSAYRPWSWPRPTARSRR